MQIAAKSRSRQLNSLTTTNLMFLEEAGVAFQPRFLYAFSSVVKPI
jgi:hypothetical protein